MFYEDLKRMQDSGMTIYRKMLPVPGGHCIMTLDVVMPKPDDPTSKKKGRVYVCDLAGTEPAGDVYYAEYKKKKMPDGSIENLLVGPHKDGSKTKGLQNQGKKINLSLSKNAGPDVLKELQETVSDVGGSESEGWKHQDQHTGHFGSTGP